MVKFITTLGGSLAALIGLSMLKQRTMVRIVVPDNETGLQKLIFELEKKDIAQTVSVKDGWIELDVGAWEVPS